MLDLGFKGSAWGKWGGFRLGGISLIYGLQEGLLLGSIGLGLRLDWLMGELGYDIIVLVFKVSLDGICGSLSNGGIAAVCVSFVLIP